VVWPQALYDRDALDDDEEDSKTEVAATAAGGLVRRWNIVARLCGALRELLTNQDAFTTVS
jgi:hypothetical protein